MTPSTPSTRSTSDAPSAPPPDRPADGTGDPHPDAQPGVEETAPGPPGGPTTLVSFLRNTWRGLVSMRTALFLLFLLALAAMPGALLPQRSL
ncbi:MAG: cytochrome c biosis protein, partial [Pseudonocardiales bacterium]|nr:cytochrome c biosis protein [Pseudonocardiales bacterium]